MSGQWEVVGKAKKKQNGIKNGQKKVLENPPKLEEILPLSQVQTLYDALSNESKENKKPGKENNVKDKSSKKPQKKTQTKKKEVTKEKSLIPKTLEAAVKMINKKELFSELELGKASFPETPLVWLKGLVGYLNTRLTVENVHPVFENKSYDYPQNLLSSDVREILKKAILDENPSIPQTLFEWCLAAMANDISRGDKGCGAVLGYKLVLQLLAFQNPYIAVSSSSKVKTLLASYHNRQLIGLSLLWAIGQGGYHDLGVGLHVWHEVMFPLMDLRLYSGYVVMYLQGLLAKHPGKQPLRSENVLPVLKLLCSPPDTVPTNRRKDFQDLASLLMTRILELPFEKVFLPLFPVLLQQLDDSAPSRFFRELEQMLLTGLLEDERVGKAWVKAYPSMRTQSRLLLQHLSKSWRKVPKSKYKQIGIMLQGFEAANCSLKKQDILDPHIQACESLSKELQRRMSTVRGPRFPWARANLLLLAAIGGLLAYDVRRHGSLRASCTGHFLHDLGVLPYVENGLSSTQAYTHQSYRWLQTHGPEYYRQASEFSRPYLLKSQELLVAGSTHILAGCQTVYSYAQEKAPVIVEWVEEWAPGLKDRSVELGLQVWEQCKVYSIIGGKALVGYGEDAVTWARTNVFVGSWSPDNLQLYSLAVLNATQHYALGTYDWLYEKVQTYSKVQ